MPIIHNGILAKRASGLPLQAYTRGFKQQRILPNISVDHGNSQCVSRVWRACLGAPSLSLAGQRLGWAIPSARVRAPVASPARFFSRGPRDVRDGRMVDRHANGRGRQSRLRPRTKRRCRIIEGRRVGVVGVSHPLQSTAGRCRPAGYFCFHPGTDAQAAMMHAAIGRWSRDFRRPFEPKARGSDRAFPLPAAGRSRA
jgi:hypothetical protein